MFGFKKNKPVKKMTDKELSDAAYDLANELYYLGYSEKASLRLAEVRDEMNIRGGREIRHDEYRN